MNNIKSALRQLRSKASMSQEAISQKMDISIPAYSKIENGITDLSLSRLEQLAEIHNLPTHELVRSICAPSTEVDKKAVDDKDKIIASQQATILSLQQKLIKCLEEAKNG
jgi:transcriptional regulator with XRE-family HTH domain